MFISLNVSKYPISERILLYDLLFGVVRFESYFLFTAHEEKHGFEVNNRCWLFCAVSQNAFTLSVTQNLVVNARGRTKFGGHCSLMKLPQFRCVWEISAVKRRWNLGRPFSTYHSDSGGYRKTSGRNSSKIKRLCLVRRNFCFTPGTAAVFVCRSRNELQQKKRCYWSEGRRALGRVKPGSSLHPSGERKKNEFPVRERNLVLYLL